MRAVIDKLAERPGLVSSLSPADERLLMVLFDELAVARSAAIVLPMPKSPTLQRVYGAETFSRPTPVFGSMARGKAIRMIWLHQITFSTTAGGFPWAGRLGLRLSVIEGVQVLAKNFFDMPSVLRFLTAIALVNIVFLVSAVFSGAMHVQGHVISRAEWWSSGSGYIQLFSSLPLVASALLLLVRSRYARAAYIFGWIVSDIGTALIAKTSGIHLPRELSLFYASGCAISLLLFAGYLFLSKAVEAYLRGDRSFIRQ
ncbi:MAG: hypothetical protein AAGC76_06875 [Luteibacter sp.]|uniref:hypothetical protein n=1 Tax=Luteibacter sp. TaxID=1886636 RepID=UPI002808E986|nr:hypothetical protein [Luteibacter sp.]MDQ7995559.1 hypothetical protein [Luteibacter sp.]MDQ8047647.1 hypothetical protein [Luteibacter sp.]